MPFLETDARTVPQQLPSLPIPPQPSEAPAREDVTCGAPKRRVGSKRRHPATRQHGTSFHIHNPAAKNRRQLPGAHPQQQTCSVENVSADEISPKAARFLQSTMSKNTQRGYANDWADFVFWCQHHQCDPLPATAITVTNYLADIASDDGSRKNTVNRRIAGINKHHELAGFARPGSDPLVQEVLRGIRRSLDDELDQAAPITRDLLTAIINHLDNDTTISPLAHARDTALLCVGFMAALRRSELVAIEHDHVRRSREGTIDLYIPHSKTDQEHHGWTIRLPHTNNPTIDPVAALDRWLELSHITSGPVFRGLWGRNRVRDTGMNAGSVNTLVKQAVARTGTNPDAFSGHSMRAGFVTSARADGIADHAIMSVTRHKDPKTLAIYTRDSELFANVIRDAGW